MNCQFPNCKQLGVELHHITYSPEITRMLCRNHHEGITAINGVEARRHKFSRLSNKHRWYIWFRWIEGSKKPRSTHLTRAWQAGLICRSCKSRSLRWSRTYGSWECKNCESLDVGTIGEVE